MRKYALFLVILLFLAGLTVILYIKQDGALKVDGVNNFMSETQSKNNGDIVFLKEIDKQTEVIQDSNGTVMLKNQHYANGKTLYAINTNNVFIKRRVIDAFYYLGNKDKYLIILEETNGNKRDFGIFNSSLKELFLDDDVYAMKQIIDFVKSNPHFTRDELIRFLDSLKKDGKL